MAATHEEKKPLDIITSNFEPVIKSSLVNPSASSAHDTQYENHLGCWDSFESTVRATTRRLPWRDHHETLQVLPHHRNAVHHEHYKCGDELSVQSRYIQNVIQPVTAVSKQLGLRIGWGSSNTATKTQADKEIFPDFVASTEGDQIRMVGEMKTAWSNNLASDTKDVARDDQVWRTFGQIARYMQRTECKYGFMSNYECTVFLKQELRNQHWVLWHSRPIMQGTRSSDIYQDTSSLVDHVSVRECFLYLQCEMVKGEWQAVNKTLDWVAGKRGGFIDITRYYVNDAKDTPIGLNRPPLPEIPPAHQGEQHEPVSARLRGRAGEQPRSRRDHSRDASAHRSQALEVGRVRSRGTPGVAEQGRPPRERSRDVSPGNRRSPQRTLGNSPERGDRPHGGSHDPGRQGVRGGSRERSRDPTPEPSRPPHSADISGSSSSQTRSSPARDSRDRSTKHGKRK